MSCTFVQSIGPRITFDCILLLYIIMKIIVIITIRDINLQSEDRKGARKGAQGKQTEHAECMRGYWSNLDKINPSITTVANCGQDFVQQSQKSWSCLVPTFALNLEAVSRIQGDKVKRMQENKYNIPTQNTQNIKTAWCPTNKLLIVTMTTPMHARLTSWHCNHSKHWPSAPSAVNCGQTPESRWGGSQLYFHCEKYIDILDSSIRNGWQELLRWIEDSGESGW